MPCAQVDRGSDYARGSASTARTTGAPVFVCQSQCLAACWGDFCAHLPHCPIFDGSQFDHDHQSYAHLTGSAFCPNSKPYASQIDGGAAADDHFVEKHSVEHQLCSSHVFVSGGWGGFLEHDCANAMDGSV
jgi:hypothetical protein